MKWECRPEKSVLVNGKWDRPAPQLIYLRRGEARQTERGGFLIAKVPGWYCPICAGSYGGGEAEANYETRRTKSGAKTPND